ncbi:MAG: J domain-containing protein [Rhodobacteraceae bacterium]|nr:J domain-containing protein [Paracoccaceae bacterium]
MNEYYTTLDLLPSATPEQLRTRYKQLIRIYHPDRFPNSTDKAYAEERLKAINEAYAVLSKSSKVGIPPEWDNPTPTAQTRQAATPTPATTAKAVVPLGFLRRRVKQAVVAGGIVLAGLAATPLVVSPTSALPQSWSMTLAGLEQPAVAAQTPHLPLAAPTTADWVPVTSPSGQRLVFILRQANVESFTCATLTVVNCAQC